MARFGPIAAPKLLGCLAPAFALVFAGLPVKADTWIDACDAPEAAWTLGEGQDHGRLVRRDRVRLRPPAADAAAPASLARDVGAERLVYECPPGLSVWFWRDTPEAAVIEEARVEADLRTTVPGVLLGVEVALPRSIDPQTGRPRRVVVRERPTAPTPRGDRTLTLGNLPGRVRARVRALRLTSTGEQASEVAIDERGAYVTRVGIAAPGAVAARELWIKELRIANLVAPPDRRVGVARAGGEASPAESTNLGGRVEPTVVSLDSDGFQVDGRLFFPRVWAWRGESAEAIRQRGFNTVWIEAAPTTEQLDDAAQHGLRLLAPPPTDAAVANASWASVLAWVLPGRATPDEVDSRLVTVERCREFPAEARRPILVQTQTPAAWSRIADGLLVDTRTSRFAGAEGPAARLAAARNACRPGTPLLAIVEVDVGPEVQQQLDALLGEAVSPGWLPPTAVAGAVQSAIGAGCRGVAFVATEPLDAPDEATNAAAEWLETTNSELRLVEPWLVGPNSPRAVPGNPGCLLLERGGVRLALPTPLSTDDQPAPVLQGVGGASHIYRITPAGVRPAFGTRVAGGLRVESNSAGAGAIVLGHDARVIESLRRYTAALAPRAATNLVRFAKGALARCDALDAGTQAAVRRRLDKANLALARRDYPTAYDEAHAAVATIEAAADARRRIAAGAGGVEQSSPLAVLPTTLTDHFRLVQLLAVAPRGPNRLSGGSFEDIDEVRRHGWRRRSTGDAGEAGVELAESSPIHGDRRLRMLGGAATPRVESPPIEVAAGELLEITGWARVTPADGRGDGRLTIVDTLGGEELSLEIGPTDDWRPFRLLRRVSHATTTRLAFSVTGAVHVDIDGVMVRPVMPAPPRSAAAPGAAAQRK